MLFYHPFVFAFCYGMGFVMSITGLVLTMTSIFVFGSSKMQIYMMFIDLIMFIQSLFARWMPISQSFWILMVVLHATYMISFSIYPFFRCYPMMSKIMRKSGYLVYGLSYVGFMVYQLGMRGFLSVYLGVGSVVGTNTAMFLIGMKILFKITSMIKENPIHAHSVKQRSIVFIFKYTVILVFFLAGPGSLFAICGAVTNNYAMLDSTIGFALLIGFICVVSNFFVTANKVLDEKTKAATDVFKSQALS